MGQVINEEIELYQEGNIIQAIPDPISKLIRIYSLRICDYKALLETNRHIFGVSFYEDFQILDFKLFSICKFKKENNYMLWDPKKQVLLDGRVLHYWHEIQNLFHEKTGRTLDLIIPKPIRNLGVQKYLARSIFN